MAQYELMRAHILEMAEDAGSAGVLLKELVATAQARAPVRRAPTVRCDRRGLHTRPTADAQVGRRE